MKNNLLIKIKWALKNIKIFILNIFYLKFKSMGKNFYCGNPILIAKKMLPDYPRQHLQLIKII